MVVALVSWLFFLFFGRESDRCCLELNLHQTPLSPGHVLGIAQGIFTQKVRFHKSVTLAFFAGEEQGLLGSAAYARA